MVRTAATSIKVGAKASKGGGGASRASNIRASSSSGGSSRRGIGGNKLIARPTPTWQKPITNFFAGGDKISPPTKLEYIAQVCEEEVITLEPPHWQTSVSNFLVKQSEIISKEDISSASTNIDEVQLETTIVPGPCSVDKKVEKVVLVPVKPSSKVMPKAEQMKSTTGKKENAQAGPSSHLGIHQQSNNAYPIYMEGNNNYMPNQNNPPPMVIHTNSRQVFPNQNNANSEPEYNENDVYMQNQNNLLTNKVVECNRNANAENIPPNGESKMCQNDANVKYLVTESEYMNPPKKRKFEGYRYLENYEYPNQK